MRGLWLVCVWVLGRTPEAAGYKSHAFLLLLRHIEDLLAQHFKSMLYRLFILTILLSLFLFSCKSTYVYETKKESPELLKNKDGFLFFENDTLKIVYNFWDNRGVLAFSIYNKLQKPLYINWKRSSFILNSKKLDYWHEEYITTGATKGKRRSVSAVSSPVEALIMLSGSSSISVTNETTVIPEKVTFIAPQSYIFKDKFSLLPIRGINIKNKWGFEAIPRTNEKSVNARSVSFDKGNTPLIFRNFFTISTAEDFSTESYISHEFYVTKIFKIKTKNTHKKYFDRNKKAWTTVYYFYNPTSFFVQ